MTRETRTPDEITLRIRGQHRLSIWIAISVCALVAAIILIFDLSNVVTIVLYGILTASVLFFMVSQMMVMIDKAAQKTRDPQ